MWSMVLELQQSSISIYQDHLVSFLLVGHGMLLQTHTNLGHTHCKIISLSTEELHIMINITIIGEISSPKASVSL